MHERLVSLQCSPYEDVHGGAYSDEGIMDVQEGRLRLAKWKYCPSQAETVINNIYYNQ